MSNSEASAADAAISNEQRNGQGLDNFKVNTDRSYPSHVSTPSRKQKAFKKAGSTERDLVTIRSQVKLPNLQTAQPLTIHPNIHLQTSLYHPTAKMGKMKYPVGPDDYVQFDVEVSSNRKVVLPDDMTDYLTKKF